MEKHKSTITINPKYLENLRNIKSRTKTTQRLADKNEDKENFSKTYSDLSFKQNIGIHKIIHYLESKSKPEG